MREYRDAGLMQEPEPIRRRIRHLDIQQQQIVLPGEVALRVRDRIGVRYLQPALELLIPHRECSKTPASGVPEWMRNPGADRGGGRLAVRGDRKRVESRLTNESGHLLRPRKG